MVASPTFVWPIAFIFGFFLLSSITQASVGQEITRIWLTHQSNDPDKVVINWISDQPGDSIVRFGASDDYDQQVKIDESTTLHHVEIPVDPHHEHCHYSVRSGDQRSQDASLKTYSTDELRIAVVANWQGKPDLSAIIDNDVHLLLTAGDNIARLWDKCGEGKKDCVDPYIDLIDAYPDLFRSIPFMPILGNHDREIRPRGPKPPPEPTYDINATAFRKFFALPGDQWKWKLDFSELDFRLIGLDLNHTSDFGTTWQTCHGFDQSSDQFQWYKSLDYDPARFTVTLYNERNVTVRNLAGRKWQDLLQRSTCCIAGFGHFAEHANIDGTSYFNTSLFGKRDQYPDPKSDFLASENNYILLTVQRRGPMTIELRSLEDEVLFNRIFQRTSQRSGD